VPISKEEMGKIGYKEFNPEIARLAPAVISWVLDIMEKTNMSEDEAKEMFININKRTKPKKDMPVSIESAWDKLFKEIHKKNSI